MSRGSEKVELVTIAMGGLGDAVAEWQGKRVFVPFALPGERVRARLQPAAGGDLAATDVEILEPSHDRRALQTALCGGCALQVWAEPAYRGWKIDVVRQALRHRGLALPERRQGRSSRRPRPTLDAPPPGREAPTARPRRP